MVDPQEVFSKIFGGGELLRQVKGFADPCAEAFYDYVSSGLQQTDGTGLTFGQIGEISLVKTSRRRWTQS